MVRIFLTKLSRVSTYFLRHHTDQFDTWLHLIGQQIDREVEEIY